MEHQIELGYIVLEVPDPESSAPVFADVVGLVPGEPTASGTDTWRNDDRANRLFVQSGPANDAVAIGVEAVDAAAFDTVVGRLQGIGADVASGDGRERRVHQLARTTAPWGIDVEVVLELADAPTPFSSALVPGGFLTDGVGFGHVGLRHDGVRGVPLVPDATASASPSPTGSRPSSRAGIELEVRFYHCNRPSSHDRAGPSAIRPPPASAPHHVRAERARRCRCRLRSGVGERSCHPQRARPARQRRHVQLLPADARPASRSRSVTAPA